MWESLGELPTAAPAAARRCRRLLRHRRTPCVRIAPVRSGCAPARILAAPHEFRRAPLSQSRVLSATSDSARFGSISSIASIGSAPPPSSRDLFAVCRSRGVACWWLQKSADKWCTQHMGVDPLVPRVLATRTTCGRKLASGHEFPMFQVVASGNPKGRSAAKEPRSGLTQGSLQTPVPTSCGSSPPLFTTYARIYAVDNSCLVRRDESGVDKANLVAAHPVVATFGRSGSGGGVCTRCRSGRTS